MANTDVCEIAPLLGHPHGVGKPQIGMADHSEYVSHSPIHHGLDHQIGDAAGPRCFDGQSHPYAIFAFFGSVSGRSVGKHSRRTTVLGRVVIPMPRASKPALLYRPLAERAALMRAAIAKAAVTVGAPGDAQDVVTNGDCRYPAVGELVRPDETVPLEFSVR